jgi:hypothetical protein
VDVLASTAAEAVLVIVIASACIAPAICGRVQYRSFVCSKDCHSVRCTGLISVLKAAPYKCFDSSTSTSL